MTTLYFNVKQGIQTGNVVIDAASGNVSNVGNITLVSGTSANLGNLVTANYFSGNGSLLTSITGANVTGYVPNATAANTAGSATTAGTVTTAAQPNITSLGTLSSLSISGNLSANYFTGNGSTLTDITGANVTGYVPLATTANTASTVTTAAQPNITSLGTLSNLTSGGTINFTTASNVSLGDVGNVHITGGAAGYVLQTNGSGVLTFASAGSTGIAGSNTQVQFNDGGSFGASTAFTFDKGTNTLTATNFAGNGAGFTYITGANVNGNVSSAVQSHYANIANSVAGANVSGQVGNALIAGTVYTNAQPNITSVGTLSSLDITGNVTTGNANVTGTLTAGSIATSGAGTGNISGANYVIANYFSGNGSLLTGLTGSNVNGQVGNALIAGTVYTNAQPNITSTGTLLGLTVTGNLNITGNINATGNLNYQNVTDLVVGDPLIFIGANNVANLYDLGFVASYDDGNGYHTGLARDASDGTYKLYDKVVAEPTTVIDFANGTYAPFQTGAFTSTGNITAVNASLGNLVVANYFSGDGSLLTNLNSSNIGNVGNANFANTAGTVTTNAQPNITSVGTLSSLSVTGNISANYFIGNGATLTSITGANVTGNVADAVHAYYADIANSVAGANVSGQVGNALIAGTVYTNAQPNITSVGTLTSLDITGNVTAGNANVTGTLTVGSIATSGAGTGNISGANYVIANYFSGNGSLLTSITGANVSGQVGNALVAGTVYTNAQPNITSLGNLTSLVVTGNATTGNLLTDGIYYSNGAPYDLVANASGANTTVQFNDDDAFAGSNNFTFNKGTNTLSVTNITANGAGITFITGSNVSGNVSFAVQSHYANIANSVTGANVSGNVASAVQSHYANIANSVAGANVSGQVGNALIAGTVYTNAQPNITSVGTLTSLDVSGTATIDVVSLTTGITSDRSNVSVTTSTVIDQFVPTTYRTAKYIISASGDDGYQSVETLLVHNGSTAYITIYGSVCSNISADIIELSSNVNGVSGNVTLYATSASANAKVNIVTTYINT